MANKAMIPNKRNHHIQIMENRQKMLDTKERIRASEAAKKADKKKNR